MLDLHVHDAHFIRLLFGMPTSVVTQGRQRKGLAEYWNTQFSFKDSNLAVQATSGTINQQGRAFTHAFEIHFEKATLMFDFAVLGDDAKYLCEPVVLNNKGKATPAKLKGGDPMDSFVTEIKEVLTCLKQEKDSDILSSDLARDAIVLCHKQTQSLERGRSVKV